MPKRGRAKDRAPNYPRTEPALEAHLAFLATDHTETAWRVSNPQCPGARRRTSRSPDRTSLIYGQAAILRAARS